MKEINIRFADTEHEVLVEYCDQVERSINEIVREAVRHYL